MRRLLAIAIVLVALPARADDDAPTVQRMRFIERGDDLTVTTKLTSLFDQPAYDALSSGFPSTVVITTFVFPKDSKEPIKLGFATRTVVYDLWDETYTVRFEEAGKPRKPAKVKYQSEVLKLLTSIEDMPVALLADLPYGDIFYLKMTVELNPVSKETLTEVRRWLTQGTGGGLDRGGVFFGTFVSVFVNPKIAEADRVLKLRSQPFYRPAP